MALSPTSAHGSGSSGGTFTEIAHNTFTATVSVTATTEGTAQTIVTASAFTADGTSAYLIEFYSGSARADLTAGNSIFHVLYEDGASIGNMGVQTQPAVTSAATPITLRLRRIPASGSRTYSWRSYVNSGTGSITAGVGGATNNPPGFIRITKVT